MSFHAWNLIICVPYIFNATVIMSETVLSFAAGQWNEHRKTFIWCSPLRPLCSFWQFQPLGDSLQALLCGSWRFCDVSSDQGVNNIGRWTQQQVGGKSLVIECQLAMLWRHRRAFTRKLTGFETTIVITLTILKLNSWDFLITSTILFLKLLVFCNNSLRVTVFSLWRSKDRKIVSLLMRYEN